MSKEFRHITRIEETDLNGTLKLVHAISKIKGVGIRMAHAIVEKGGVNPESRLGFLPEQELDKLIRTTRFGTFQLLLGTISNMAEIPS